MTSDGRKVALVTGSSSGLGAAVAAELLKRNYRVIGLGRRKAGDIDDADFIVCDLNDPAAVEQVPAELARRTDRLDMLVNNAGFGGYATWEELPAAELRRMFEVDFFAPVRLAQLLLGKLSETRGAIINISSVAALAPVPCMGAYSAVKAALKSFSQTLRAEASLQNVRVLTVCPGRISTGFSSRAIRMRECPETPGNNVDPARFARRVVNSAERNRALIVYGHNMASGQMFAGLNQFLGSVNNAR
ncbi:MAG: SDR family NAD(P)-dependent oxidoreductase, partial [Lentisphaeria bacterium]|nr:SDR family NAD(P)-dependent oxidoreductase [Lentisphaeria bacterium]